MPAGCRGQTAGFADADPDPAGCGAAQPRWGPESEFLASSGGWLAAVVAVQCSTEPTAEMAGSELDAAFGVVAGRFAEMVASKSAAVFDLVAGQLAKRAVE